MEPTLGHSSYALGGAGRAAVTAAPILWPLLSQLAVVRWCSSGEGAAVMS